jgi:DNA-binding NtrC family response regulator
MDNVLAIDDDRAIRSLLTKLLSADDLEVHTAESGAAGLKLADEIDPEVVILDLRLPDLYGMDVLHTLKTRHPETTVIIMTAYGQVETAVEAMRKGASDYLEKPLAHIDKLRFSVRRALAEIKARRELRRFKELQAGASTVDRLVGESAATNRLRELVTQVARSEAHTVLILGESGTGKELVARALHYGSVRAAFPFIEVNCAAIAENLFESELFGHEQGAFTDARATKKGLMELADRGTLFLDEIGEMTPGSQAKLLRCLQERVLRRVGGDRDIKVDVRVVAATNRALDGMVEAGKFRDDLYYRLNVIPITIPPLRERKEDILPLARHFLAESNATFRKTIQGFSPEAEALMLGYPWPGNVRELRNLVERLVILGATDLIEPRRLPFQAVADVPNEPPPGSTPGFRRLAEIETSYVRDVLRAVSGNKSAAAKILGITRQTLRKKLGKD